MISIPNVTNPEVVFGLRDLSLIPKHEDLPRLPQSHPWVQLASRWFFEGASSEGLFPKEGVDKAKALRFLQALMGSMEPGHNHKMSAVAYYLSEWFVGPTE